MFTGTIIARSLQNHLGRDAGRAFTRAWFQCFADRPDTVRRPEVAVVSVEKIAAYTFGNPHLTLVPDLAVDVLAPGRTWDDVREKRRDFHAAGVPLIWVADPLSRRVFVEPDPVTGQKPTMLMENDELTGGKVLPGFSCRVGDLFPA